MTAQTLLDLRPAEHHRRLAARIDDLKRAGYNIGSTLISRPGGIRYAEYRMEEQP